MLENHRQKAVISAWEQELQNKQNNRWFAHTLLKQGETVFQRFSNYYSELTAMPRRTRRTLQRKWSTTLAGAALIFALSGIPHINVAHAAEITVDGRNCTLVDAIEAANTDSPIGGCDAGDGDDTLIISRDISLRELNNTKYGPSGTPVVTTDITIIGNGHTIERDRGREEFRVFTVANGGTLRIHSARISHGKAEGGGGILATNDGGVALYNTIVSKNEAKYGGGGVAAANNGSAYIVSSTIEENTSEFLGGGLLAVAGSDIEVIHSTVSGNEANNGDDDGPRYGGGIAVKYGSEVGVKYSTISENSAAAGGGAFVGDAGELYVVSSTISGNHAEYVGGGIFQEDDCGCKYATVLINSTVAKNEAEMFGGGGIFNEDGGMLVKYSTIAGNESGKYGGGIATEDFMHIHATIISGNTAEEEGQEFDLDGPVELSYSIVGHDDVTFDEAVSSDTFAEFDDSLSATSDEADIPLDAIIEVRRGNEPDLKDNGGYNHTIALVDGSPAIDFVDDFGIPTDQRGFVRDGLPDTGAFEFGAVPLPASCDLDDGGPFGPVNVIVGTEGRDRLEGTNGNDIIIGLGGDDEIRGLAGNDCLIGGEGDDKIYAGEGDDIAWGGELDDEVVYDRDDRDRLHGEEGDDIMHGGGDRDHLEGDDGDDSLHGGDGDDGLHGDDGNDSMWGNAGNDRMDGHDGDDEMWGGDGDDTMDGRDGNDRMWGSPDNDRMNGGDGNDEMYGGDGEDRMDGGEHDDYMDGDAGNDTMDGRDGEDEMYGGPDDDNMNGGRDNDIMYGDDGGDGEEGPEQPMLLPEEGEDGDDRMNGDRGDDRMYGNGGNDILEGRDGEDHLFGNDGDDELKGGKHDDFLNGGADTDELNGESDDDTCVEGEELRACEFTDLP
ncbi:MAG: calcium-binding protein [Chloroflexota bacterium]